MIKNGVYIKKLKVPSYKTSFWVVVSESITKSIDCIEDMVDHRIAENKKAIEAYTYAYQKDDGKYQIFLFITPKSKPGTIAHESLHVVNVVYHWHGVKPSYANDESQCYLLDWVVEASHNAVKMFVK